MGLVFPQDTGMPRTRRCRNSVSKPIASSHPGLSRRMREHGDQAQPVRWATHVMAAIAARAWWARRFGTPGGAGWRDMRVQ